MNKKLMLAAVVLMAGVSVFADGDFTRPMPWFSECFPSTWGGLFFSNSRRAVYRERKVDLSQYEVVGPVKGFAEMINIMMLVNFGDTSLGQLKADALKGIDADDIVNIEIDAQHLNVFLFCIKCEAYLRGVAVKYKYPSKPAAKKK